HAQDCAYPTEFDGCDDDRITLNITSRCDKVGDVDHLLGPGDARDNGFRSWLLIFEVLLHIFDICRRALCCGYVPGIALVSLDNSEFGPTNSHGVCQHSLENGPQLARRA